MRTLSQKSLGRYQIEAEIGRGAMGVVYRALDPTIDRIIAIKTISLAGQDFHDDGEYRQRFAQEARAAGRLSHPGIVTIFDAGEDPENHEPYLVMEHVSGKPLSSIISDANGKLPLPMALQFAQEIAEALDYAHSHGVIHGDIKPANILVTDDGHAKIADFGVARLNQEAAGQVGWVVGSPAYMAPEQMAGEPADPRSDLFSLGVIFYSMITGFRPFQGNSAQTVCFKVMNVEPVPVTSFQHDVPAELDAIISRAIAKDPDERYQSGAEMAADLQPFRDSGLYLAEETRSFARLVQTGKYPEAHQQRLLNASRKFFLGVAFSAIVFAGLLFAWRVTRIQSLPLSAQAVSDAKSMAHTAAVARQASMPVSAPTKPTKRKTRSLKAQPKKQEHPNNPQEIVAAAPAPTAKIQFEIQHHFTAAKASIWMDDELIFDQPLRGPDQRHPLLRSVEMNQVATFQFAPGKHWLQVRIMSPSNTYDQIETLEADLSPNSERIVHVNCDKRKMQVSLQ